MCACVTDTDDSIEAFYAAVYPRLVGQLVLLTGNRAEAEELAQDAVLKLLPRWSRVSRFDDPEAWLRRTAMNLAISRWRRARVAARGLVRLGVPRDVDAPDGGDVDLARALATLPHAQREVLVLHHVAGVPLEQVAAELGVPVGTVKSRLSRGRAALAPLLGAPAEPLASHAHSDQKEVRA